MKKFLALILFFASASAEIPQKIFSDVPTSSQIFLQTKNLCEKKLWPCNGFFRASEKVVNKIFYETFLRENGFLPENENAEIAEISVPENISADFAPFFRAGIFLKIIDKNKIFSENQWISRIDALEKFLKLKKISPPSRVNPEFRKKFFDGNEPKKIPRFLNILEAGVASKILSENISQKNFVPHAPLQHREIAQWIFNFQNFGQQKSNLDSPANNLNKNLRRSNYQDRKKNSPKKVEKKTGFQIPNGTLLEEIWRRVAMRHFFYKKLDDAAKTKIMDAAAAAMVQQIGKESGDKYSNYFEPEKAEDFTKSFDGEFEGIGAYVEIVDGKFTITAPIVGSPAEKAEILAGDIVTHAMENSEKINCEKKFSDEAEIKKCVEKNWINLEGKSLHESIDLVKGKAGTRVDLKILRDGEEKIFSVERGKITVPSIDLKWEKNVPILGIHQFTHDTKSRLEEIIKNEILPAQPNGIILDLRNNPGGFLTAAVAVGEYFLPKNKLIFSVKELEKNVEYRATRTGELANFSGKILVLQNRGSASASEIIAAMLQDYKIATIIGEKSLGKGTVQEILNFSNGGILKLTIAQWLSPNGRWIHEKGIEPDILLDDEKDPLEFAVNEILQN